MICPLETFARVPGDANRSAAETMGAGTAMLVQRNTKNMPKATTAIAFGTAVTAGGILLLGLCAGLLYVVYASPVYLDLRTVRKTATPRVDAMLAAIEAGDCQSAYDVYASEELRETVPREHYAAFGDDVASRLGKLQSRSLNSFAVRDAKRGPERGFDGRPEIDVTYRALFEKGQGTIHARLTQTNGDWKFMTFWVDSPLLGADFVSRTCSMCGRRDVVSGELCPPCNWAVARSVGSGRTPNFSEADPAEQSDSAEP